MKIFMAIKVPQFTCHCGTKLILDPGYFLFLVRLWHVAGFLTPAPPALRVPRASTFIMKQNNNHLCQTCMFYLSVYA